MEEQLFERLINYIETLSPKIWEIYLKQVYVNITKDILWVIFFSITIIYGGKFLSNIYFQVREIDSDNKDRGYLSKIDTTGRHMILVFGSMIGGFICLLFMISFTSIIGSLINPEYYAIKLILSSFGN